MQNHQDLRIEATNLLPFSRRETPSIAREIRALQPARVLSSPGAPRELSRPELLAHDARNALTSLELIAGLVAEPGVLAPAYSQCGKDLVSVALVLRELVGELANGSAAPAGALSGKGEVGKRAFRKAQSAGAYLQGCTGMLRALAGTKVELYVSTESALPVLAVSEESLTRVLMNLVKNSSEAMPNGGVIHITARRGLSRTAPSVLIHVADTGDGIPAHALDQIFRPGFSSKRTAADSEERGLGLAIVREIIEGAGGEIRVASTIRKGTTFELKIPCLDLAKEGTELP